MYSDELLNDVGYSSQAQKHNRLLIESENLDDYDDGFTRKNCGGGKSNVMQDHIMSIFNKK